MAGRPGLNNRDVSHSEVISLLHYDELTGKLFWKFRPGATSWNARFAGKEAGSLSPNGYIRVNIHRVPYQAHQLIWFIVHGTWADEIDHEDHDRSNNRIGNLRDATPQMNSKNRGLRSDSTSGYVGVSQIKKTGRWRAYFHRPGQKQVLLGVFGTKEEAIEARKRADNDNEFHPNHGIKAA